MKELENDVKINIIISALEERYRSLHVIRERVQNIGIWLLGVLFSASAWIIQSDTVITPLEKVIYLSGTIITLVVLRFNYLGDLCKGFKGQQQVAARLEKTLGLFESGKFDNSNESIYPKKWENSGKENGDGKFFKTTYTLLYIGTGFLILVILLKGFCF